MDPTTLEDPKNYTYKIGFIEQMMVPDGVLNMTTIRHDVYPGTIRRTVLEFEGNLFIFTSGAGQNNFNNIGDPAKGSMYSLLDTVREITLRATSFGNDKYGPIAFKALDHKAFQYVESVRNGKHQS
jgi:hypothetical protein